MTGSTVKIAKSNINIDSKYYCNLDRCILIVRCTICRKKWICYCE